MTQSHIAELSELPLGAPSPHGHGGMARLPAWQRRSHPIRLSADGTRRRILVERTTSPVDEERHRQSRRSLHLFARFRDIPARTPGNDGMPSPSGLLSQVGHEFPATCPDIRTDISLRQSVMPGNAACNPIGRDSKGSKRGAGDAIRSESPMSLPKGKPLIGTIRGTGYRTLLSDCRTHALREPVARAVEPATPRRPSYGFPDTRGTARSLGRHHPP